MDELGAEEIGRVGELIGYVPIMASVDSVLEDIEEFERKKANFTKSQLQQIQAEKDLFGVSDRISDEGFVKLHKKFCQDIIDDLDGRLPEIKKEVVERVSRYLAGDDELEAERLSRMIISRLEATTKIELLDGLASESKGAKKASFRLPTRQIEITLSEILRIFTSSQNMTEYGNELSNHILAHEVIHGILAIETESNAFHPNFPVRNGVDLRRSSDQGASNRKGEWLNEAMIESLRNELFRTGNVSYELHVIILEMLELVDPGLRKGLIEVALSGADTEEIFARIEMILGGGGIDSVENLLKGIKNISDVPLFKRRVLEQINEKFRDKAKRILEDKEKEYLSKY